MKTFFRKYILLLFSALASLTLNAEVPSWSVNPNDFQYDMSVFAALSINGEVVSPNDYTLAAFCGQECRGIATVASNNGEDYYYYMRVRSNVKDGETIVFCAYNLQTNQEVNPQWLISSLEFRADERVGFPSDPYIVTFKRSIFTVNVLATEHGTVEGAGEYEEGTEVTLKAIPDEGYKFVEWSNGVKENPYTFKIIEDIEISASFNPELFTITYMLEDSVFKTDKVEFGSTIESPEVPEKEGYSFTGWSDLPQTMPAHDVTVSGSYTINSYTLTFKIGNEVISESVVEFGSEIIEPEVPEKEGYIFAGWEEHPDTMPGRDLVINGHYKDNSYKLTYIIDDEIISEQEVEIGTVLTPIEAPEKEGYKFDGWVGLPETMPEHDVTVTGSYSINSYKLSFMIGDEVISESTIEYGTKIEEPIAPEKEGYTFTGWDEHPETMPGRDLIIKGQYTVNSYQLTFVIDGVVISQSEVEFGTALSENEAPEKEGYTFNGWVGLPETMPANDVTVTGSYTVNSYKLTFMIDEEVISESIVEYGSKIVAPSAPEKEGYTFNGWEEYPETMPSNDITITGSYSINTYTLTYVIDDKVIEQMEVEYGSVISAIEAPEKEGYTFNGWDGLPETMPAKDVSVTGTYTINSYTLTFKIGNVIVSETVVEYGSKIVEPEAPEKEGFDFAGWDEHPDTMPAYDLVINGHYEGNSYKLTYMIDGEVIAVVDVEFDANIDVIEAPEKEGYTFNGWEGLPETMPSHDVTVTGSYTVNTYTLTFIIDEEIISEQTVEYSTKIVAPEAPEKEGYTFNGWSDVPETMPAEDLTVFGSYTVNTYTVTYIIDDEVIRIDYVEYGEFLPEAPAAPEKEDYDFVGWSEIPETMPAEDIVIVGTYEYNAGLNSILMDSVKVNIFDIQGRLIKKNVDTERIADYVQSGIYIINGQKVLIK